MSVLSVRNLPPAVHRALKLRAAKHGRSTEAEVRAILLDAVSNPKRLGMGSELERFGATFGGLDLTVLRDPTPIEPADFG
jgi:plasmid stability protein